jgi:hypothetical protein
MNQRILYSNPDNSVAVIVPTGELSIEATAKKDVPTGVAYWIVDVSEIPSDRTDRDAWELVDMPEPDGYGE